MNQIMIACVAALSLVSVAGCSKSGGGGDEYLSKMEGWKTDICKCKAGETACAQKVLDDQKKYTDEMAKKTDKDAKPDPAAAAEMMKKLEPITAEFNKCKTAAMTAAAGSGAGSDKKDDSAGAGSGSDAKPAGTDPVAADPKPGSAAADPADAAKKIMADYGAVKDKLCACADKACTTKLKAEADDLEKNAKTTLPNPTREQKKEFRALEKQVNACARKFK